MNPLIVLSILGGLTAMIIYFLARNSDESVITSSVVALIVGVVAFCIYALIYGALKRIGESHNLVTIFSYGFVVVVAFMLAEYMHRIRKRKSTKYFIILIVSSLVVLYYLPMVNIMKRVLACISILAILHNIISYISIPMYKNARGD